MQKSLYIQLISLIILASLLIKWMLSNIVFVRQKWTYTSKLQDAFVTIHDCDFIHVHEILTTLLIVHGVGWIIAPCFRRCYTYRWFLFQGIRINPLACACGLPIFIYDIKNIFCHIAPFILILLQNS